MYYMSKLDPQYTYVLMQPKMAKLAVYSRFADYI